VLEDLEGRMEDVRKEEGRSKKRRTDSRLNPIESLG
jgi:hypothetical protein